jgi:hypothetical protein
MLCCLGLLEDLHRYDAGLSPRNLAPVVGETPFLILTEQTGEDEMSILVNTMSISPWPAVPHDPPVEIIEPRVALSNDFDLQIVPLTVAAKTTELAVSSMSPPRSVSLLSIAEDQLLMSDDSLTHIQDVGSDVLTLLPAHTTPTSTDKDSPMPVPAVSLAMISASTSSDFPIVNLDTYKVEAESVGQWLVELKLIPKTRIKKWMDDPELLSGVLLVKVAQKVFSLRTFPGTYLRPKNDDERRANISVVCSHMSKLELSTGQLNDSLKALEARLLAG